MGLTFLGGLELQRGHFWGECSVHEDSLSSYLNAPWESTEGEMLVGFFSFESMEEVLRTVDRSEPRTSGCKVLPTSHLTVFFSTYPFGPLLPMGPVQGWLGTCMLGL